MIETKKLWKLVLEDLQVTMTGASFTSFILPLNIKKITPVDDKRVLVDITCPNSFHQQMVEGRFYLQLKEVVDKITEKSAELRFALETAEPKSSKTIGPLFSSVSSPVNQESLAIQRVGLREDFTFDSFAVSSSNETAHAAAVAVAESFGTAYNPLFIYGGVGVGKTHLSHAVAIEYLKNHTDSNIIVCMSEEFTNGIIEAIQQRKTPQFRNKYRKVKGLLIDDIQFIAGKNTVQEEFFHTFNAILKAGGQVVMTSDRSPSEIPRLESRLRSRFEAGLLVDISQPGFELKTAITLIKSEQKGIKLSMEHARLISANIESARQIEGFITRLNNETLLRKKPISDTLIQGLLGKTSRTKGSAPPPLRPLEVVRGVANYYNLTTKQIRGSRRPKPIVTPRHIAMYLLRVDYKLPFTEIGMLFSNRDHTTIMHAVEKITTQLKDIESLRIDVNEVRKALYE